jgi:hypothetical protein
VAASPTKRFREGELCVLRRNSQVAGDHDFGPATQTQPVHRRDHRLVEVGARRDPGKATRWFAVVVGPGEFLQVGADAERPLAAARDDGDVQIRVRGIQVERTLELEVSGRVERVEHLGAIDRHREDRTVALHPAVHGVAAGQARHARVTARPVSAFRSPAACR